MTDSVLLTQGMETLIEKFGIVDAERFVFLLNKEPFDYTKFHGSLLDGMSIDQLCDAAAKASENLDSN